MEEIDPADIQADITPLPSLAAGVDARVRTFSVGLDPNLEQTAAEWFESLGYRTLTGDVKYTKGYWGGTKAEADPRLGASFCAGAADLSPVEDYDFANWLPVPNLMDDIASAYPDAKFILFESDSARWLDNVYIKAQEAALKGHKCGCGGDVEDRVASAKCALGDGHHFCDLYPCVYERTFATTAVDPDTWVDTYVNHVKQVKSSLGSRLLVVDMSSGAQSPIEVSKQIAGHLGMSADPSAFALEHPFEPHVLAHVSEHRWLVFWFACVGALGAAILFAPSPFTAGGAQFYRDMSERAY